MDAKLLSLQKSQFIFETSATPICDGVTDPQRSLSASREMINVMRFYASNYDGVNADEFY